MHLAWIELRDFRSYRQLMFRPDTGINVLVGPNGAGKTSVLEGIGYLATLRSFRRSPEGSLVREGAGAAIVRGEFSTGTGGATVEIETPESGRRRVLLNGKGAASRGDVATVTAVVAFLPDDLDLVKRGPSYRREYLDDVAAQAWPGAAADQSDHERALRQRNALLRKEGRRADEATLDVWDDRVSRLGAKVLERRLTVAALLEPEVAGLYDEMGEGSGRFSWTYQSSGLGELEGLASADALAEPLRHAMTAARQDDLDRRTTTVGPHRDELVVQIDDRDARTRASQGEQRSISLGMRIAAFRVLTDRRGFRPVLLLDDVFSELDADRGKRLVGHLPEAQVFVTSARAEEVPLVGTRWTVGEGKVERA
ncbi:MAG TPA: DNA replication/repair protein RecF [Acidimicrobiia bacterium]|nr:DNA replication/repair protein RecF [Acidimicrobiia bacterium]